MFVDFMAEIISEKVFFLKKNRNVFFLEFLLDMSHLNKEKEQKAPKRASH